jgi:hypothetical protein
VPVGTLGLRKIGRCDLTWRLDCDRPPRLTRQYTHPPLTRQYTAGFTLYMVTIIEIYSVKPDRLVDVRVEVLAQARHRVAVVAEGQAVLLPQLHVADRDLRLSPPAEPSYFRWITTWGIYRVVHKWLQRPRRSAWSKLFPQVRIWRWT